MAGVSCTPTERGRPGLFSEGSGCIVLHGPTTGRSCRRLGVDAPRPDEAGLEDCALLVRRNSNQGSSEVICHRCDGTYSDAFTPGQAVSSSHAQHEVIGKGFDHYETVLEYSEDMLQVMLVMFIGLVFSVKILNHLQSSIARALQTKKNVLCYCGPKARYCTD